jgi:hypothetical protein
MATHMALLFATTFGTSACLDPRFPVDAESDPTVNVPPKIDEDRIEPAPSTNPTEVNVGVGCLQESFKVNRVVDADLPAQPPSNRLVARWHLTVQIGTDEFGPTLLEERVISHSGAVPGAELSVPGFTITKELLNTKFLGRGDLLVWDPTTRTPTHLLEFHVTDADFLADSYDVTPESADADSAYWWVAIVEDVCTE